MTRTPRGSQGLGLGVTECIELFPGYIRILSRDIAGCACGEPIFRAAKSDPKDRGPLGLESQLGVPKGLPKGQHNIADILGVLPLILRCDECLKAKWPLLSPFTLDSKANSWEHWEVVVKIGKL
jgi:hypothetical protein